MFLTSANVQMLACSFHQSILCFLGSAVAPNAVLALFYDHSFAELFILLKHMHLKIQTNVLIFLHIIKVYPSALSRKSTQYMFVV